MAEFPKKENLEQEEISTIFSDPAEHREIKKKQKKLLPKIVAGVLCIGILIASTVAIVKLIPEKEEENSTPVFDTVNVMSLETDELSEVTVENSNGTTKLYSKTVEKTSGEDIDWFLSGVDSELTVSLTIENVVNYVANITAIREITAKTAEECGFDSPVIKAEVVPKKGDTYTVLIGAKSPDNGGYYLKLAEKDNIYLVTEDVYTSLEFNDLDFATSAGIDGFDAEDESISSYYENDVLSRFDNLTIYDKDYQKPLIIVENSDAATSDYYAYMITSPDNKLLATGRTDELISLYTSGITTSGAYSYDVSDASLKKFGLDKPDLQTTMSLGNTSLTYKFALQEDGYYAVISNESRLIQKVQPSLLTNIVDLDYEDYYSTALFVANISDMANFTVTTPDKTFSFDLVKNEVDEDETDPEKLYTITSGERKLVVENFQNLYMQCLLLQTKDFAADKITSNPEITFSITLHSGKKLKVEFTKVNSTRYQCEVDGIYMGRVSTTSLNDVLDNAERASNGESVADLF
ncbi:MAG: DUF4340 domain-containing protein [Clostridia bacterium]|nr:DUF4340 domain-containing protein [Clostridia bacterium]